MISDLEYTNELNPSVLGTKGHWDQVYKEELENYKSHGDVGEIWFGVESISRVIKWLEKQYSLSKNEPVIDLGCGNGMMLIEMAGIGFTNMLGIDYSQEAINLAQSIVITKGMTNCILLKTCDLLEEKFDGNQFSLALDKGTYDAISLSPENSSTKRNKYMETVHRIIKPDGFFILTSCNWTEDELSHQFKDYFQLYSVIKAPTFKFGGKTGNLVACVVMQKKKR